MEKKEILPIVKSVSYLVDNNGSYGIQSAFSSRLTSQNHSNYGSITYCVHGKPLNSACCDGEESQYDISKIDTPMHCHKPRVEGVDLKARRKLIIASVLCVIFMILEIVGGVLSNSLAIATDAAHLLSDFASFMISLFALWVSGRPSTKRMSFGWYRAEVIGALISVLMIWIVTGILVYMAVHRVIHKDFELNPGIMLATSGLGVIVNIIMGCTLHQHGHSHGSNDVNINVRAAFIHVLGDFIQSFGVFFSALIIYFVPGWELADPICTFLFSILVLITTFAIMKDALLVLMEGTPKFLDYTDVMTTFLQIEGVERVHNLRIWGLSINKVALSAHLAIDATANPEEILKESTHLVHGKYNFFETTLQIEIYRPTMEDCGQCENPKK